MANSYKILATDYDYLNPKEEIFKQKKFFQRLIQKYHIKSCLDCACGTGWHLFMLSQLGLQCSGSDISKEMLSVAKENLNKNVPIKREDFRSLRKSWKEHFDMVVCLTTSLPHMTTDQDTIRALRSMYERLKPGGILVVDNGITDRILDTRPAFIPARIYPHRAFYFFLEYVSPKEVIFNVLQIKKTKKGFAHTYEAMHYNAMRESTLQKYFKRTKFSKVAYYGDHHFSKYSRKTSSRLIAIAQKINIPDRDGSV
jgi:ubiquinone/menaquinone biosynthesis C-methylase UbiE